MWKIALLPLDERPCNLRFPAEICAGSADIELVIPPSRILGRKKRPADTAELAKWLLEQSHECDALVISIDMLVYGGIVPSRVHTLAPETCLNRLGILEHIKKTHPELPLYAFSLIMRAPEYNSCEEEPDYYSEYGELISKLGKNYDDAQSNTAGQLPLQRMGKLDGADLIPSFVLDDFQLRRATNHKVNLNSIDLADRNVLDFLVIPLDDCAETGWAPMEQRVLRKEIIQKGMGRRIHTYSGADEVGSVLVARAVNMLREKRPLVYVRSSATIGHSRLPKYEDRMLGESIKWQIITAGGIPWECLHESDFALFVNAPTASANQMAEADVAVESRHRSYVTGRCLPEFLIAMEYTSALKPVALADIATANGADDELMVMLARSGLSELLFAYGGWNTAANALGTCIAQAMIWFQNPLDSRVFTDRRIVEDWIYMTRIRKLALDKVRELQGNPFALGNIEWSLKKDVENWISSYLFTLLPSLSARWTANRISFPWDRLFEIDFEMVPTQVVEKDP